MMIGFLVRGWVRIRVRIRVRVGFRYNIRVYHWSNCHRSKCCTFNTVADVNKQTRLHVCKK